MKPWIDRRPELVAQFAAALGPTRGGRADTWEVHLRAFGTRLGYIDGWGTYDDPEQAVAAFCSIDVTDFEDLL